MGYSSRGIGFLHSGEPWQQEADTASGIAKSSHLKPQAGNKELEWRATFGAPKPTTSDLLLAAKPHILNLPRQHYQLETKYPNIYDTLIQTTTAGDTEKTRNPSPAFPETISSADPLTSAQEHWFGAANLQDIRKTNVSL